MLRGRKLAAGAEFVRWVALFFAVAHRTGGAEETSSSHDVLPVPLYKDASQLLQAGNTEYEGYNGWFNNLADPHTGAVETPIDHQGAREYRDGVSDPSGWNRPSPIAVSEAVMRDPRDRAFLSYRGRTVLSVFFGQHVAGEILDTQKSQCLAEFFNITIPAGHHLNPHNKSDWFCPFKRSSFDEHSKMVNNPRRQLNFNTPFIDGSAIYGTDKPWSDSLRQFTGGRLSSTLGKELADLSRWDFPMTNVAMLPMTNLPPPRDNYIKSPSRLLKLGNRHSNENPVLLAVGIVWYRYHNLMADKVAEALSQAFRVPNDAAFRKQYDEEIFQEARKWVIATQQKIIYYDWLPQWLATYENGSTYQVPSYTTYRASVRPQISSLFQAAAMRYGESLVPGAILRRLPQRVSGNRCQFVDSTKATGAMNAGKKAVRLCNAFWNAAESVAEHGVEAMLLGASSQVAEREDTRVTPDLRGFVYGGLEFTRRDLMAVTIQRGRDHGLGSYNRARMDLGLEPVRLWTQINPALCGTEELITTSDDCFFIRGLREVYNGSLDDIDVYPGGLSETTPDGPGPLFQRAILLQFNDIRDGDRFWFENRQNRLFSSEQIERIRKITFRDIMLSVTNVGSGELGENPFFHLTAADKCRRIRASVQQASGVANLTREIPCPGDEGAAAVESNQVFACNVSVQGLTLRLNVSLAQAESLLAAAGANCSARSSGGGPGNDSSLPSPFDGDPCPSPYGAIDVSNRTLVEECTPLYVYDYFTGSELWFALTFLSIALVIVAVVGLLCLLARLKQQEWMRSQDGWRNQRPLAAKKSSRTASYTVSEWLGRRQGTRPVMIKLTEQARSLDVHGTDRRAVRLRRVTFRQDGSGGGSILLRVGSDKSQRWLLVNVPKEFDLVLHFDSAAQRDRFLADLESFATACQLNVSTRTVATRDLLETAVTKAHRDKQLELFFTSVFAQALDYNAGANTSSKQLQHQHSSSGGGRSLAAAASADAVHCELSKADFAEALSMKPDSLFVHNMFTLIDKNSDGYITFREFLDMLVIFTKGDAEAKAKLLFDIYDIDGDGAMTVNQFKEMLRSLMELANAEVKPAQMEELIESMFDKASLSTRSDLTFADFQLLLNEYKEELQSAQLGWDGTMFPSLRPTAPRAKVTFGRKPADSAQQEAAKTLASAISFQQQVRKVDLKRRRSMFSVAVLPSRHAPNPKQGRLMRNWIYLLNKMENQRRRIFWVVLYTLVCCGIFAETFHRYAYLKEHLGVRRITGYSLAVSRGSAAGVMFTSVSLLVTMCRNTIMFVRETFIAQFVPIDDHVQFHKLIALYLMLFSAGHVVGHAFNFYAISTQNPEDLQCVFADYPWPSNALPKFFNWCWGSLTGFTGVLVTLVMAVMYIFATQYSRQAVFRAFWVVHNLYPVFYALTLLHGMGMVLAEPSYHYFLSGPLILFALDKLVSVSRNKVEISVLKAELLPSGVTALTFKKPANFQYRSGQYVRIACIPLGKYEYHPFTLTSAPHEDHLSVHVRMVGPWTRNLRQTYDPVNLQGSPYPKLYLDGPFGKGHQDWYRFDVAVLVGGGIGVTPFASILKDIVHKSKSGLKFQCKKVYFMWITQSQKQFEWLVDIIKELEDSDEKNLVSVHVFITQFYERFDIRTTMLYICERHFQKLSGRSLFTGLLSLTHFGRPDMVTFLDTIQKQHPRVSKIGAFSCGPPGMTHTVDEACSYLNKRRSAADSVFAHHYENF